MMIMPAKIHPEFIKHNTLRKTLTSEIKFQSPQWTIGAGFDVIGLIDSEVSVNNSLHALPIEFPHQYDYIPKERKMIKLARISNSIHGYRLPECPWY
jgi:hypothetical protein